MKTKKLHHIAVVLVIFMLAASDAYAQVGIGTSSPDASALLDMHSNSKGLLAPRMTTVQRNAIASPAESLLVYDTDEKAFFYYNTTTSTWIMMANDNSVQRDNYKLIKSEADLSDELTAGGGSKYLLDSSTVYEINGSITLSNPIELNNAFISGVDTNEDKLVKASGDMFIGSAGGTIKQLTLSNSGGSIFNLTGSASENVFIRTVIIANSSSVGTIDGYNLVLMSLIQYAGNTTGITYSNIKELLLSNLGWFNSNSGTYETYSGTFDLIEKQGGFMAVDNTATGIDVSSNPAVSNGVLSDVSFSGSSTEYIKKYTTGTYPNYNFTKDWTINCPGLKSESDAVASANIYYNGTLTSGFGQAVPNNSPFNLVGNSNSNTTTAVNMLRASSSQNNRITYTGKKTRTFQVNAALSVRGTDGVGTFYAFFIRKNGVTSLVETNTVMRVDNISDVTSNAISGTVELAPNDYIEIWGQRLTSSGTNNIAVFSLNLSIR